MLGAPAGPRVTPSERRAHSDHEVAVCIAPELLPVWQAVRTRIKATPYMSRLEAFEQWVHDNSATVERIQDRAIAASVRRLEREARRMTQDTGEPGDATDAAFYAAWLAEPAFPTIEREIPRCGTAWAYRPEED